MENTELNPVDLYKHQPTSFYNDIVIVLKNCFKDEKTFHEKKISENYFNTVANKNKKSYKNRY